MALLLALAASIGFGSGDFMGGIASRRASVVPVVAISHLVGLGLLGAALLIVPAPHLRLLDLAWGAGSGVAGGLGVALLYRGLAAGPMSVVAPVAALCNALVPVLVGLATGDRPAALSLGGVACALVSIALISGARDPGTARRRVRTSSVLLALGAGAGFGGFFVLLARASHDAGLWPLIGARSASASLFVVLWGLSAAGTRNVAPALRPIVVAGVCDVVGNVLYLLAVQRGLLSLVGVVASLYPTSTVVLAVAVLGERLRPAQTAGLAVAVASVVLIVLG